METHANVHLICAILFADGRAVPNDYVLHPGHQLEMIESGDESEYTTDDEEGEKRISTTCSFPRIYHLDTPHSS